MEYGVATRRAKAKTARQLDEVSRSFYRRKIKMSGVVGNLIKNVKYV
jgi:hypothetical protein